MPGVVDSTPDQRKRKRAQKDKTPASQGSGSGSTKRVKSIHDSPAVNGNGIGGGSAYASPVPGKKDSIVVATPAQISLVKSTPKSDKKRVKSIDIAQNTPAKVAEKAEDVRLLSNRLQNTRRSRRTVHQGAATALAIAEQSSTETATWFTSRRAGGRFIDHDALFSPDNSYVFASNGREVQILSIATSLVERSLPAAASGLENTIAAFALSAADSETIYVASKSGRIQRWDWVSGEAVDEPIEVPGQIRALTVSTAEPANEDILHTVTYSSNEYHIRAGEQSIYTSKDRLLFLNVYASYVVSATSDKLVIGKRTAPEKYSFVEIKIGNTITSLDGNVRTLPSRKGSSADSLLLAVGNDEGQIMIFEDVFSIGNSSGANQTPRTLHWHREAVNTVKWSRDGNYLISGGRETVLVIWQLATGKKQFLPHLTAEIKRLTVSPAGTSYAIQLADNSVMVMSTSELKPIANFAGLQAPVEILSDKAGVWSPSRSISCAAATINPLQHEQLLLAVPASSNLDIRRTTSRPFLQTYDITTDRHIARQALTRNNVTDFNKGPEGNSIVVPDVTFVQISHDGQWMATVEEWAPPVSDLEFLTAEHDAATPRSLRKEIYLKIWQWNAEKELWSLETRVDSPHQCTEDAKPGRVLALVVDPVETGFATIGEDSCARIWKPKSRLRNGTVVRGARDDGIVDWSCRHTVQLGHEVEVDEDDIRVDASAKPHSAALAYSEDGSMLAVSQCFSGETTGPVVHFVNASSGEIEQTRAALYTGTIKALGFLDRHLIVLSELSLNVWDVVDETLRYRSSLNLEAKAALSSTILLAVNREDNTFAVSTALRAVSRIRVYNTASSVPEHTEIVQAPVSALLTTPGRRGYTLLTTAAEVCTLLPKASALQLPATTASASTTAVQISAPVEDPEAEDMETDALELSAGSSLLLDAGDEDADKPVVRPEQLANVFDAKDVGRMPIKDMFSAIVGLYARKPRGVTAL